LSYETPACGRWGIATGHGLGSTKQSLAMAFRDGPRGHFGLSHSFTAASQPVTVRRTSREKGVATGGECRSFYPVLPPKPGLRYQLGPAKTTAGGDGRMMQACDTRPQPIHGRHSRLSTANCRNSSDSFDSSLAPVNPLPILCLDLSTATREPIDRPRAVRGPVASRHSPHVSGFVHLYLARQLQPS